MSKNDNKITRADFIKYVSTQLDVNEDFTRLVCDSIIDSIIELSKEGYTISFPNFGKFKATEHKGHPVQYSEQNDSIGDYKVLKFYASKSAHGKIRN